MTKLEKEIENILKVAFPDYYYEHQRQLILPRLVKWHKGKVENLTIPDVSNRRELFENMQYYMEYCEKKGYVTPQFWLSDLKHF